MSFQDLILVNQYFLTLSIIVKWRIQRGPEGALPLLYNLKTRKEKGKKEISKESVAKKTGKIGTVYS